MLQKYVHRRDIAPIKERLISLLSAGYLKAQQVVSLVNYMVQAAETSDAETFVRQMMQRMPQYGGELMTIAEQLERKGFKKGIQKGMEKGLQKGIVKGGRETTLKIAAEMLKKGLDRLTVISVTGLSEKDLAKIQH